MLPEVASALFDMMCLYRELEYVSDYTNFLDFCRLEMLPNVRPKQRPGEGRTGRRK